MSFSFREENLPPSIPEAIIAIFLDKLQSGYPLPGREEASWFLTPTRSGLIWNEYFRLIRKRNLVQVVHFDSFVTENAVAYLQLLSQYIRKSPSKESCLLWDIDTFQLHGYDNKHDLFSLNRTCFWGHRNTTIKYDFSLSINFSSPKSTDIKEYWGRYVG